MSIKYIYWFAPYNLKCPSTKYRGKYPVDYLIDTIGIRCKFFYPEKSFKAMLKFCFMVASILFFRKKNSLLVIQKVCTNNRYAKTLRLLIKLKPTKGLYDLDDAEYIRYEKSTLEFFLKNCESVSVGSSALYDYVKPLNSSVFHQTSPVVLHYKQKIKRNKILHIGWVGDLGNGNTLSIPFSHKTNMFKLFFPELRKIDFPVKLTLVGVKNKHDIPLIKNYFKNKPHIKIEIPTNLDWENDAWIYSMIRDFDIGIAPMTNHLFNRSKSAFKAKQYLSTGVPTIACDVGDTNMYLKHGLNGFLVTEHFSYADAIKKISGMSDEDYFNLSTNSLNSRINYSMENYCLNLLNHFKT